MPSVLEKTVASLETALRYNPDNIELMGSLAEGYIRMGRLDGDTIALVEKVLAHYPSNEILQQAQAVAFVIEQADEIDAGLAEGKSPPKTEDIASSIEILEDFLKVASDSALVWFAWTRLCALAGFLGRANKGIKQLKELEFGELGKLRSVLDWIVRKESVERVDWLALFEAHEAIGEQGMGLRTLEKAFDNGIDQDSIGPRLLALYLTKYSPANAGDVPEEIRVRLFQMLLDYGDAEVTADWLRKASLFGWEITNYSKAYVRELVREKVLDTAFEMLQRMALDNEVRTLLNEIAQEYENQDDVDNAVRVLKYINDHVVTQSDLEPNKEAALACEMEFSLAEFHMKSGRREEALVKYVAALCLKNEPDLLMLERIDELLSSGLGAEPTTLLRLAAYFRNHRDHPKTVYYLNHLLDNDPENAEALHELQVLFDEILQTNPDNPELRLELGKLHRRMGKLEESIAEFERAAASPQREQEANRQLALTYQQMGNHIEAIARFQDAQLGEKDLEPLFQLHHDLAHGGDDQSALVALRLINQVQADYRDVSTRIRQLEEKVGRGGPGTAADPKMRELIGDLAVGRYRFVGKIGSGGMGQVYKVYDERLHKDVAMKILRDSLGSSSKALDRFFREARIAASIHHRNIVEIYDYNISSLSGQSYICMEYISGPTLRTVIDGQFCDTVSISLEYVTEMLYYMIQLFDALEATHTKGIVHRDVKPDNIMLSPLGEVKVTDFGIVHVDEATFTPTGAMLGTPRYMSPEQVTGTKVDGRSDIYSVGILLYEILVGSPPFMTGDISYQQVNRKPVEPSEMNTLIPQSVNDFIMKCLEKDPADRPASAKEAKAVLAVILEDLGGCEKYESRTVMVDEESSGSNAESSKAASKFESRVVSRAEPMLDSDSDAEHSPSNPSSLGLDDDFDLPTSI